MAIRVLRERNGDARCQQAHVSWYGSSTSSLMPANTLQPFLQMFKARLLASNFLDFEEHYICFLNAI